MKSNGVLQSWRFYDIFLAMSIAWRGPTPGIIIGDSGAPVFNLHGRVVGMAHGGIPSSAAQIAWMVPSARILNLTTHRTSVENLPRYDIRHVFSAVATFYTEGDQQRTPFGTNPSVAFALEWPAIFSPLKEYASRLDKRSEFSIDWLQNSTKRSRYGGREIQQDEPYFPTASMEPPYDCTWNDKKACEESNRKEKQLLELFDSMTIEIVCYRSEVFETILTEIKDRYHQADLRLEIPLGKFTKGISEGRLGMSYDWGGPSVDKIYLYTKSFIQYRHGIGTYKRHPDIEFLEDLYGGACRIGLGSINYSNGKQIENFENYLRFGGACLHLILAPNTHTPIAFTSHLPLGENLSLGGFWGLLPLSHVRGTIDDMACH